MEKFSTTFIFSLFRKIIMKNSLSKSVRLLNSGCWSSLTLALYRGRTLNPQFWEKSQPVPGAPKQSCSTLQNFSWRPCEWLIIGLTPNEQFSAVSRWEQFEVTFWFNQPAELDFYSASSMKLQYAFEHVAPLGQIMIPIQSLCSFSLMLRA